MAEDVLMKEKRRKLQELKDLGINPFPYSFEKKHTSKDINEFNDTLQAEEKSGVIMQTAGRIMTMRNMGKIAFSHIQDEDGKVQLYFAKDTLGETYKLLKKFDLGDIIGVSGEVFKTRTGEVTLDVQSFELLTKSIKALPEKYHGLKDKELRYRQRYIDLIMNQDVKEVFKKRSVMIAAIREFLSARGFMEVETPLLQTQYGGASARPFETHINAWNMKMYLSISPELYLKRLIVGGFEKVFTICKNFRNEGVDMSHNPEFTMIEIYQAYADYNDMMKLIEECYEFCALKINGTTKVTHTVDDKEITIDFKAPWPKKTMAQAIKDELSIDVLNMQKEDLQDFCDANGVEYSSSDSWGDLVLSIFELVEDSIIQPTHIYDMPKEGTPLCKRHRSDDRLNEQCEPIGLGMELGNMYSELNDPDVQLEELKKQVEKGRGGDEESHPMDDDFINAIQVGMPPTGGIGWGIDRMAILLTGAASIRDVILFPTMKPEEVVDTRSKSQIDKEKKALRKAEEAKQAAESAGASTN
ncbi:MAG: lysine--tRNA ligase [Candidatus Woesearchaeota archaeon]